MRKMFSEKQIETIGGKNSPHVVAEAMNDDNAELYDGVVHLVNDAITEGDIQAGATLYLHTIELKKTSSPARSFYFNVILATNEEINSIEKLYNTGISIDYISNHLYQAGRIGNFGLLNVNNGFRLSHFVCVSLSSTTCGIWDSYQTITFTTDGSTVSASSVNQRSFNGTSDYYINEVNDTITELK